MRTILYLVAILAISMVDAKAECGATHGFHSLRGWYGPNVIKVAHTNTATKINLICRGTNRKTSGGCGTSGYGFVESCGSGSSCGTDGSCGSNNYSGGCGTSGGCVTSNTSGGGRGLFRGFFSNGCR